MSRNNQINQRCRGPIKSTKDVEEQSNQPKMSRNNQINQRCRGPIKLTKDVEEQSN